MSERIIADLDRHAQLFELDRDNLGARLLAIAQGSIVEHFDGESNPDGGRWPELSEGYARAKAKSHPGAPIGVREGLLRGELAGPGDRAIDADSAEWTACKSDQARSELQWMQDPGDVANRPPRPVMGWTPETIRDARALIDGHFQKNV